LKPRLSNSRRLVAGGGGGPLLLACLLLLLLSPMFALVACGFLLLQYDDGLVCT
jgi:hypothetical protein